MDYKFQEGSATSWRRAYSVNIQNPTGGSPSILFHEEDVFSMGGELITRPVISPGLLGVFDASAEIPLVNPETGDLTGQTATHQDLYVLLHSLYMQLARERDAREAAAGEVSNGV